MISIGLDARPLTGQLTGIGRYVFELCHALDRELPEAKFLAYTPYAPSVAMPSDRWQVRLPESVPARLGGYFWFKFLAPALIARDPLDWFFGTRTLLPRLGAGVRTVSLVHDLNHVIVPRTMTPLNRWAHRLYFRGDVRRATRVVANSAGTAERLLRHCGRRADLVLPPDVAAHFAAPPADRVAALRSRLGLAGPYLLSVATMEPRKNLAALIAAFQSLRDHGALAGFTLALAGGGGWGEGELAERLRRGIPGVRHLGFVDDADLPGLYAGAEAFVFPSLYEGYGIPVAEALACGTRVVTTDIPELREAAQGRAVLVAPDTAAIALGIEQVLRQPRPAPLSRGDNAAGLRAFAGLFSAA